MIGDGIQKVISAFEAKFDRLEKRISILEGEEMNRDIEIRRLSEQLEMQVHVNIELQKQVESMDMNGRMTSLIFTCSDFGKRRPNEEIEQQVVDVINKRDPDIRLTAADLQTAHRLQGDDKVIVKFAKQRVRDSIYERRFSMNSGSAHSARKERLSPLYVNESLTPSNRAIYNELLEARKPCNGAKIASVFTRRGVVFCRRVKRGDNIMVADQAALRRVLDGSRFSTRHRGRPPPPSVHSGVLPAVGASGGKAASSPYVRSAGPGKGTSTPSSSSGAPQPGSTAAQSCAASNSEPVSAARPSTESRGEVPNSPAVAASGDPVTSVV
ncbi:uncharacterized protein LOC122379868 [Amphibalanus amphitrite]|uniref:uncharacterized protein LOC122379868 n=1 Tax=Amphibalanus amphitrite TaxID=1232801 RepID=UPI001C921951|nr:uncharacterized protein LOC122379868 [Amphibalanus amphitrite]